MLKEQNGNCAICGQPIEAGKEVLDHCHKTGVVRGVLHRGCNSMLGVIENNAPRYELTNPVRMERFLRNLTAYRRAYTSVTNPLIHPTFKTVDEKRDLRNARARRTRAKAKENA